MIRHISGTVASVGTDNIVVDVQGVGYLIYVSKPQAFPIESNIKLHTHQAVRETALDLYGFATLDELDIFELLLGLPKIGPKSAAQIMSQADIELLIEAVSTEDPAHLSKLSGIGKKTAEKVVAGLKDSFEDRGYGTTGTTGAGSAASSGFQSDAVDALVALGYPQAAARKAVQNLSPEITSTNEAVSVALKELSQS